MSTDETTTLRGTEIYLTEVPNFAKANHIPYEGRAIESVLKELEAIPDEAWVSVDPATEKIIKEPIVAITEYIRDNPNVSCKEISEYTVIPVKTVTPILNELFNSGKIVRAFDGKKTLRYALDASQLDTESNQQPKNEEEMAKSKTTKTKSATKAAAKPKGEKKDGVVSQIRALLDKGKTREQILEMGKFNKSTIYVQAGKWAKENKKKK